MALFFQVAVFPQTSSKAPDPHEDLFLKYKDPSEDRIGPEGITCWLQCSADLVKCLLLSSLYT